LAAAGQDGQAKVLAWQLLAKRAKLRSCLSLAAVRQAGQVQVLASLATTGQAGQTQVLDWQAKPAARVQLAKLAKLS